MAHKNNYYIIHACIFYKVHPCCPFYKCCWAFGYNHQGSRHFQTQPKHCLVDWEMWLQQTTEFQVTTTYVSLISSGKASGILPAFLHISRGLYVGTCLSIPPHRTGALWGSDGSDSPCLLPDICWMNEWVKYFPCTPALTSLRQCLAQRRNKYWMNSYICEYRDSEELCCITGFCLNISKPDMSFLHCFS